MLNFVKSSLSSMLCGPVWHPGAGELVIHLNARNKITNLSGNAGLLLGRTTKGLKGQSMFRLVEGSDQDKLAELLNYIRRTGKDLQAGIPVQTVDLMLSPAQGMSVPCSMHAQPAPKNGVVLLVRERAFQESEPDNPFEGFSADRLADLSHEMKTPLNAILGFSDAMRERTFGPLGHPRYQDYADHIYTSGEHLMDLVTSILDMARIKASKYDLKPVLGNVTELAAECAEMIRPQIKEAGLNLVVETDVMEDSLIDIQAIRQILINLLSNAVKFTSDGTITVRTIRQGEEVCVTVQDTGIGMSQAAVETLGNRFTDTSCDGVRGTKGTGLGLSLAASLAKLHGGSLSLDSAPGEGVLATLILPFTPPLARGQKAAGAMPLSDKLAAVDSGLATESLQYGQSEALKTQMERIDDYRHKVLAKRGADAA